MAAKGKKIFISYRREDAGDAAGRIRDWLVQTRRIARDNIFMDVTAILPGADFMQVIEDTIGQCHAMIVVISPSWLAQISSPTMSYVRLEVEAALRRRIALIPVLVGGAQLPSAEQLPATLRALTRLNIQPVRHESFDYDMGLVRRALGLGGGSGARWVAAISALLLVALSLGVLSQGPEGNPIWVAFHAPVSTVTPTPTMTPTPTSSPTVPPTRSPTPPAVPNTLPNSPAFGLTSCPNGAVQIRSVVTGDVIQIIGDSTADGAQTSQYDDIANPPNNLKWTFIPNGDGSYRIVSLNAGGKEFNADGDPYYLVVLHDVPGAKNLHWACYYAGSASAYKIMSVATQKVVSIQDNSSLHPINNPYIIQAIDTPNDPKQLWQIVAA